ncbi:MAG: DUF6090 family protein [Bacteroidota bacterium]
MLSFFRNIRQNLIEEKHFTKYALYALGEILLVVIGILIALQIDNYAEVQKEREKELILLSNLSKEVDLDIQQIENNTRFSQERLQRLDSLVDTLNQPDSIDKKAFVLKSFEFVVDQYFKSNSGIFDEAISSGKMSYVQNEPLRQSIFNYYRNAKETYTDQATKLITDEFITPLIVENLYLNQEGFAMLDMDVSGYADIESIDFEKLTQNRDFWRMVILKFGGNREQILRWEIIKERAEILKQEIDNELERLQ